MPPKTTDSGDKSDPAGFTKVTNRKKHNKKPPSAPKNVAPSSTQPSSSNIFNILIDLEQLDSKTLRPVNPSSTPSKPLSPIPT